MIEFGPAREAGSLIYPHDQSQPFFSPRSINAILDLRAFSERGDDWAMDACTELRVLDMLQGYLADLICEARHPAEIDALSQALESVQRALVRREQNPVWSSREIQGC